jgi:hypothetical protein
MSDLVPSECFLGTMRNQRTPTVARSCPLRPRRTGAGGHVTLRKHPQYLVNVVFTCHSQVFQARGLAFDEVIGKNGVQCGNVLLPLF